MGMAHDEDADRLVEAGLLTCAAWHVEHGTPYEVAVADLRFMADGRCDLLGHVAGMVMGEYLADPGRFSPCDVRQVAMLVEAGGLGSSLVEGFELGHRCMAEQKRGGLRELSRRALARAHVPHRSR